MREQDARHGVVEGMVGQDDECELSLKTGKGNARRPAGAEVCVIGQSNLADISFVPSLRLGHLEGQKAGTFCLKRA